MRPVLFAAVLLASPLALADQGGFVFLPPLVASQPQTLGALDDTAQPTVQIVDISIDKSVPGAVPYGVILQGADVRASGNHFTAAWSVPSVAPTDTFRITVWLDKQGMLGQLDAPASMFPPNQTYPVKFFFNKCAEVTCAAANQCHDAGVCDPSTGTCSTPPLLCPTIDACHTAGCDETLGICSHPVIGNQYPSGPYGTNVGDTIADLSFDGVTRANPTVETTLSLANYFQNPDLDVLVIDLCAMWCSPCIQQQRFLQSILPNYNGRVGVFDLLAQNQVGQPPSLSNLTAWAKTFFDVGADPTMSFMSYGDTQQAFPFTVVVRVRDMKISWVDTGFDATSLQGAIESVLADTTPSAGMCTPL